jgi:hypothetical protein
MRVGTPPRADLVWAQPDAKAANDRRLAHRVGIELDEAAGGSFPRATSLPHATIVESVNALIAWTEQRAHEVDRDNDARSADGADAKSVRWVVKAPWTTAGRDRCHGDGAPTGEQRTRVSRLLEKFGALVVEPWVERIMDVGVCARVDEFRPRERDPSDVTHAVGPSEVTDAVGPSDDFYVTLHDPHSLITDARGTFLGIALDRPPLEPTERMHVGITARAVGARLASMGFRGPFAIDAFVYRDDEHGRRLHALCEINARHTFGHIAHAFGARGAKRLGFSAPPPDATILVAPANDGITAWIA